MEVKKSSIFYSIFSFTFNPQSVFYPNPIKFFKSSSALVVDERRNREKKSMTPPACYRSHIPSHFDVILLLPFPSVNTLQVSHIRWARIGATIVAAAVNGERNIEKTEAAKLRESYKYAAPFSRISHLSSLVFRTSRSYPSYLPPREKVRPVRPSRWKTYKLQERL